MTYQVLITPAAQRQLKKLTSIVQKELVALIESLSEEPRPLGCKKLKGRQNEYRMRSGDYRIIYSIEDATLIVRVIKVGHRRDVYEEG
jgi:mRNA interferase RelE/StbE